MPNKIMTMYFKTILSFYKLKDHAIPPYGLRSGREKMK
jgi:hypothetical protein